MWSLDVWMIDRHTDRPTLNRPLNRLLIDPKSTHNRPTIDQVGFLRPQKEQEDKINDSVNGSALLRFEQIRGRSWAPLDFDFGFKIVQQSLRRDFSAS